MKPHPKLRKTIKWGGAVVTVLLVGVWVGSAFIAFQRESTSGLWIIVGKGVAIVSVGPRLKSRVLSTAVVWSRFDYRGPFQWWFRGGTSGSSTFVVTPLWAVAGASLAATVFAWRLDILARGRAKLDLCPKCNYDRTGLALKDAKCPECGSLPS